MESGADGPNRTHVRFLSIWPLFVLLALLSLAACTDSDGSEDDAEVRLLFVADDGLGEDAFDYRSDFVAGATHAGLTGRAADGRVIPALASSWRVLKDGRSYVFKMREASWPDGREITSGDVVAVLRRLVAPGSDSPLKPWLMDIEGAVAVAANRAPTRMLGVDDPLPDIVTIELSQPDPTLLAKLALPAAGVVRTRDDVPPPSGAYAVEARGDAALQLLPNPSWFGADQDKRRLAIAIGASLDPAAAVAAYDRGEVDIVMGGTTNGLDAAQAEPLTAALKLEPTYGLYGYLMRADRGPLADVRVRRALAMAVDREALLRDELVVPGMQAAYGPLPPTLPPRFAGAVPDWSVWNSDARQAEARRLLTEAGYGPGNPLSLDVAIPQGSIHEAILGQVAEDLAPLGVRLRAYRRSPQQHRQTVADGDYDLALSERIRPVPEPRDFLAPFSCAVRAAASCDPDADDLLQQADLAEDAGTRTEMIRRAARLLSEDALILPLFSPVRWSLVRPGITGWESNISGGHPPRFWRRGG